MTNEEKLKNIFLTSLGITEKEFNNDLKYHSIPQWDSISHMSLVSAIDDAFGTMMDVDDVTSLNTFSKAKEILIKYGIQF